MSILEILEAHTVKRPWSEASRMRCKCGETVTAETEGQLYTLHRAHVAQVLEQHEQEAKAEALEDAIKTVRVAYDLQCPVRPSDQYVNPSVRIAHKWWETVLGGRLDDLERRAAQLKESI